jgi:hypothetical protein
MGYSAHLVAVLIDQNTAATRHHALVADIFRPDVIIIDAFVACEGGVHGRRRDDELGEVSLGEGWEEGVERAKVVLVEPVAGGSIAQR